MSAELIVQARVWTESSKAVGDRISGTVHTLKDALIMICTKCLQEQG